MSRITILALLVTLLLPAAAAAQSNEATVALTAQNNSGISGTATLTQVGADLRVVINVTGSPTDGDHPVHIHSGACPAPGAVVHELTNVVGGTSTTTLAGISLASVADGNHAINLHESSANTEPSGYISCGNIAAVAMEATPEATATGVTAAEPTAAVPAALPATGGGGSSSGVSWAVIVVALIVGAVAVLPQLRPRAVSKA